MIEDPNLKKTGNTEDDGFLSLRELGKVESADVFIEDHGILTFYIILDFGGSGQGFGGYCLDNYSKEKKRRIGSAAGGDLYLQILNFFAVDRWSDIVGRTVYALRNNPMGDIIGLEIPKFDKNGGKKFFIKDWQDEWFPNREDLD